jgi:hypothetical protein
MAGFPFSLWRDPKRYMQCGHHPVTSTKLNINPLHLTKFNNRPASPTINENLQFPATPFFSPPFPSPTEQPDLYSGSEEVRSSILLGSTKFPDIFCMFLNG